jgi:hypothetical protein
MKAMQLSIAVLGATMLPNVATADPLFTSQQTQTQPFNFNSTIFTGASDVQSFLLPFSVFKTPKYVGTLNSISIQGSYDINLTFDALTNSVLGDSWPFSYNFSFMPSTGYTAGALGTATTVNVTYQCFAEQCITGGQPFPGTETTSSISLDKTQLGLRTVIGKAGGPLTLTETTTMGGALPATLNSQISGSITATANYTANFPPDAKKKAEGLSLILDTTSTGLSAIGSLIDPGSALTKGAAFVVSKLIDVGLDKLNEAIGDASGSAATAYKAFETITEGVKSVAELVTKTGGIPTNPAGALIAIVNAGLSGLKFTADKIAADPPDSNYKEIATIQPVTLSDLGVAFGNSAVAVAGTNLANSIFSSDQELISVLVSLERAQGAAKSNDQTWALDQLQQLSDALVAFEGTTGDIRNEWTTFVSALTNAGLGPSTTVSLSGADLVSALLNSSEFDRSGLEVEFGISDAELNGLLAELESQTLSDPTGQLWQDFATLGDRIYDYGDLTSEIRAAGTPEPPTWVLLASAFAFLTLFTKGGRAGLRSDFMVRLLTLAFPRARKRANILS